MYKLLKDLSTAASIENFSLSHADAALNIIGFKNHIFGIGDKIVIAYNLKASVSPSVSPSENPSVSPSESPSISPSKNPSVSPSDSPSVSPSESPSVSPSESPSVSPSKSPLESVVILINCYACKNDIDYFLINIDLCVGNNCYYPF